MNRHRWATLILLTLVPLVSSAQVAVSLVAADRSIQPGREFTAGLRLEHQRSWHTYWINAGTGYATSIIWDLPPGWTAGAIQWPVPKTIVDSRGTVTGNGYDGLVVLPITITPPANLKSFSTATLNATAKWLMCSAVCIPGDQLVSLTIPVTADLPLPNEAVRAELAQMPMPQRPSDWKLQALRSGTTVTLDVTSPGTLLAPHVFSDDAYIQYDLPQSASTRPGHLQLTLPIADDAEVSTSSLTGVLAYTDAAGAYRGVALDVALSEPEAGDQTAQAPIGGTESLRSTPSESATWMRSIPSRSFAVTLLLSIVGGMVLNLMPCVFPVLGIKVLSVVNQYANTRRQVAFHGIAYTVGVLLSFWILTAFLLIFRAGGKHLGWGFQLQSPGFVFSLTVVMLFVALNLSGVFEVGLRITGIGSIGHTTNGYFGTLCSGALATVVATPCSAPFLAPALGAALVLPTVSSFLVFTCIGLGLSIPYLLLTLVPQAVHVVPRAGRWMETIKQAMAFPVYATMAYLIWVLAGQTTDIGLLKSLLGLTSLGMGAWLYGRFTTPSSGAGHLRVALTGGLALFALGIYLGWPRATPLTDIVWEPWSAARVARLQLDGRPIYVDFTARWCATCQANKELVFSSDELKRYFRDHRVATLKADWTNSDSSITAELAKYHRSAVPFTLVYRVGASQPDVLPDILTSTRVLAAFK